MATGTQHLWVRVCEIWLKKIKYPFRHPSLSSPILESNNLYTAPELNLIHHETIKKETTLPDLKFTDFLASRTVRCSPRKAPRTSQPITSREISDPEELGKLFLSS
ncbi:hypothetical protein PtB15_18B284 [Puccinia triticina]|nr:hypothetical protein PtB15_18B284 [Puccinia triticina]